MTTGNGGGSLRGVVVEDLPPVTGHRIGPAGPRQVRAKPVRRRRHVPWIVLGATLAAFCGLGVGVLVSDVGNQHQVLVASHAMPAGHVFTPGDFRFASISESGVEVLNASDENTVIGRTAAVAIASGAPLVAGDIGAPDLAAGTIIVAVLCKPGQFPPSLAPGQHVQVLVPGATAAGGPPGVMPPSPATAVVVAIEGPSDAAITGTVVTLQVDQADAAAIAQAGADGHVSLLVVGAGG